MSGGGIGDQDENDDSHVVIFTFTGKLNPDDVKAWNRAIRALKQRFGPSLVGLTSLEARAPRRKT